METSACNRLALALDNISSLDALAGLIKAVAPSIGVFKIGLELFCRFGPPVCGVVRKAQRKIFLDLKLHDIPATVEKAVRAACVLEVDYLTVHAQGGVTMLSAAVNARRQKGHGLPKIIGVTLLTSIDAEGLANDLLVAAPPAAYAKHLASLAVRAGLDGIVCSAADLPAVKPGLPPGFEIITPGIRPAGSAANDQKRIATPGEAVKNGATLLVVGRAVTEAPDPARAAAAIAAEIAGK
ncbi:MAG: orotidine-5'-phosphate decarboxylase [Chitinispirillaceae bacterium]|nr:orotidine-5'-phosphate decarboxylase [Chitinispirillaceae bacterium]